MAGLYEQHDRARFEIVAIDNGHDDGSPMRQRLKAAFDGWLDIAALSGAVAAQTIAEREIDILVNLNGYFGRARMDVFARRAAPLQVNYLGFPGTLGASYMDYIVADGVVIPPGAEIFYTEKVVRLPHSYQVNDDRRAIAPVSPTRAEAGLPERGMVFCNFNQDYKILPEMFGLWLALLRELPGSVLWLLESNFLYMDNLKRTAAAQGVDPARVIFAPALPLEEHLARLKLGDLFLDSLPYNAHTTASDALWAGLPVLTCMGTAFAGRVCASLLSAIGLPELIAGNLESYRAAAIALAQEPARLAALKSKLARNRTTTPLFDTRAWTAGLEAAYAKMRDIHAGGGPPQGFDIPGG